MKQQGNVLFLILIAVVLFAALSYAVTQSSRGGGDVSADVARIKANEVLNYFININTAYNRVKYGRSCAVEDISFENDQNTVYDRTPTVPDKCRIYHESGGGLTSNAAPQVSDYPYLVVTGANAVLNVGDAATVDLVAMLSVPEDICIAYNELVGIDNPSGVPPTDSTANTIAYGNIGAPFVGTFTNSAILDAGSNSGWTEGCFFYDSPSLGQRHIAFTVLEAR